MKITVAALRSHDPTLPEVNKRTINFFTFTLKLFINEAFLLTCTPELPRRRRLTTAQLTKLPSFHSSEIRALVKGKYYYNAAILYPTDLVHHIISNYPTKYI